MSIDDTTTRLPVVGTGSPERSRQERRRRGHKVAITLLVVVLLLVGAVTGAVFLWSENIGNNVTRVPDVFTGLDPGTRPAETATTNVLLVGTDSRADTPTTGTDAAGDVDAGSQRSDVIMIMQMAADGQSASVVSIPRDSWVDIPGHGRNKVNAAYAFGGASLLTRTVEQLTGIRVDHFGVIDFAGFEAMVTAVGGIDVQVAEATSNAGVDFAAGTNHLDGPSALAYVRQRYDLPGGDLDRARRQQNALRALLSQAASSDMLSDPAALVRLVDAVSRSVSVDDTLSNGGLRDLAFTSRGLRPASVQFLTAPVAGLGREGEQSVVHLDDARAAELWTALQNGDTRPYADAHPDARLGDTPS